MLFIVYFFNIIEFLKQKIVIHKLNPSCNKEDFISHLNYLLMDQYYRTTCSLRYTSGYTA